MAGFLHKDPKSVYGNDLIKIFGPQASRRHISTLSYEERKDILNKIPEYIDTDDLGPRPSFFQITNKVLWSLQQSGALQGVDLDWCPTLTNRAMRRHPDHYFPTDKLFKNNSVQRGIWLRHLLEDILFQFDPDHVLMSLARKHKDGSANLNNGQHRTVACIIMGIRDIPIEWIESDLESVDVDLYATDNLRTLSASPFDEFRIQVRRNQVRKAEKRTDLIPGDVMCERIFDIHTQYGSRFVEKGNGYDAGPKECTGVGNMINYYQQYGDELYDRAVSIICSAFPKAPLATSNVWGLLEFMKEQKNNGFFDDEATMDWAILQAITYKHSDPKKSTMHLDIRKVFKEYIENGKDISDFLSCPEPRQVAAGIGKLCRIVHANDSDINWAPIKYNGRMVEDTLNGYKVMPLPKMKQSVSA
jgi:hypothetical protein